MANSPANAGDTTSVILSGTVTSTLAITATPNAQSGELDLSIGQFNTVVKVADLNFGTNRSSGLIVYLSSDPTLKNLNNPGTPVNLQIGIVEGNVPANPPANYVVNGAVYAVVLKRKGCRKISR